MPPPENTAPESKILINDADIPPELLAEVFELVVCQYSDGPSSFDLSVNIVGAEDQALQWVDDARFDPGNKVEIQIGYLDQLETLIVGEITALHPKYLSGQAARMHIQGFDKLHRLRRGRKTRTFVQLKDSQMAQQIASDAGLAADVEDSEVVFDYALQNNVSDLDFLRERARRIRYEVRARGDTLVFRKEANQMAPAATLEFGTNLKEFCPRLTTVSQLSELTVRAWNPGTKEAILGVARVGDEDSLMGGQKSGPDAAQAAFGDAPAAVVDLPLATQAEAAQVAHALYNQMALEFVSGEGETVGNGAIQAGTTIELTGVGQRFGGNYYVKRAEHRLSSRGGYTTKFQVTRSAE